MFHNSLVHGSAANHGRDRRILLLIEMACGVQQLP